MPPARRRMFDTVRYTEPTADEALLPPAPPGPAAAPVADHAIDVQTPRRPEATVAPAVDVPRIAFTWRLTPDEADRLDTLVLRLRRQLNRGRLDKATVLAALVTLADDRDEIRAAVLERLR